MGSELQKIRAVSTTPFLEGCVEAEEEIEREVAEEEPLEHVTICKHDEKDFILSNGRKILFSDATVTHLNEEDWSAWNLNSMPYIEGNYLMRSANFYALMGPEFEKNDEQQCNSHPIKSYLTNFTHEGMLHYLIQQNIHYVSDTRSREPENPFRPGELKDPFGLPRISIQDSMGRVDFDYNDEGAFEKLSVIPLEDGLLRILENYTPNSDDFSEIKIIYTADGEYTITGLGHIPFEIETTLKALALRYMQGFFS